MCGKRICSQRLHGCLIVSLRLGPQLLRDVGIWPSFLCQLPVKVNPFCGLKTIKIEREILFPDLGLMNEGNFYKLEDA